MSSRFEIEETDISGLRLVRRKLFGDSRGFLARVFCADDLAEAGWREAVAQVNHTHTALAGTIRGLHFQTPPQSEMKLVTCLRGSIFDVAVDLRKGSPTFLSHRHATLSAENHVAFLIPKGCAHGFQTLTDDVELLYLHSARFAPEAENGLSPFDPRLAIEWPRPVTTISTRDSNHARLSSDFQGIAL